MQSKSNRRTQWDAWTHIKPQGASPSVKQNHYACAAIRIPHALRGKQTSHSTDDTHITHAIYSMPHMQHPVHAHRTIIPTSCALRGKQTSHSADDTCITRNAHNYIFYVIHATRKKKQRGRPTSHCNMIRISHLLITTALKKTDKIDCWRSWQN